MTSRRRSLHFVFKIGDRNATVKFYRNILGMKILRHEEFEEGCKASCNGPYDGKWSKSMVGYGPEDGHFVVELTYNYGIKEYTLGNDFQGLTIHSKSAVARARELNYVMSEVGSGSYLVEAPGGYKFHLFNTDTSGDPVKKVSLGVSNLSKSLQYWSQVLGMNVYGQTDTRATLGYNDSQCSLELVQLDVPVNHATAFGRIAFSCPREELPVIQNTVKEAGHTVLTPLVALDTPGKATVEVVILTDPDGHEICFVGDEAFRELSKVDPKGDSLINEAMEKDKSNEWFAKRKAKQNTQSS